VDKNEKTAFKPVLSAGSDFQPQVVLLVRPGLVFWGRLNQAHGKGICYYAATVEPRRARTLFTAE